MGGAIQLWLLQLNADFAFAGPDCHGALQAPDLVCVLPNGNYDPGDMQTEKQRIIIDRLTGILLVGLYLMIYKKEKASGSQGGEPLSVDWGRTYQQPPLICKFGTFRGNDKAVFVVLWYNSKTYRTDITFVLKINHIPYCDGSIGFFIICKCVLVIRKV